MVTQIQKKDCVIHAFQGDQCCDGECKSFTARAKAITDKSKAELVKTNWHMMAAYAAVFAAMALIFGLAAAHADEVFKQQDIERSV